VFHEVLAFASDRLRSGPFEGPATVKPPALPGDIYSKNDPEKGWIAGRLSAVRNTAIPAAFVNQDQINRFRFSIFLQAFRNRSPYRIESVAWPYIGDLRRPAIVLIES
jgi:hypothetical protein